MFCSLFLIYVHSGFTRRAWATKCAFTFPIPILTWGKHFHIAWNHHVSIPLRLGLQLFLAILRTCPSCPVYGRVIKVFLFWLQTLSFQLKLQRVLVLSSKCSWTKSQISTKVTAAIVWPCQQSLRLWFSHEQKTQHNSSLLSFHGTKSAIVEIWTINVCHHLRLWAWPCPSPFPTRDNFYIGYSMVITILHRIYLGKVVGCSWKLIS